MMETLIHTEVDRWCEMVSFTCWCVVNEMV